MSDHLLLYSHSAAHSDDTIYPPAGTDSAGASESKPDKDPGPRLRRPKSRPGNDAQMAPGMAVGGGPAAPSRSHHRRSVSLLGRLRHPAVAASPAGSPTSSESSSRDTRSDRTLAHTASSGSMRNQAHRHPAPPDAGSGGVNEPRRPTVHVLPPPSDAGPSARKRGSLRGDRPGFISQLLRGQQRSPRQPSPQPARHVARSPGTPPTRRPAADQSPARGAAAGIASAAEGGDHFRQPGPEHYHQQGPEHYHSHCHFGPPAVGREFGRPDLDQSGPEHIMPSGYAVCSGPDGAFYVSNGPSGLGHMVSAAGDHHDASCRGPSDMNHYGPSIGWYGDEEMHAGERLASTLPVYEPIDMGRFQSQHDEYGRATRPVLPDARMLAPMASLADVYESGGMGDHRALSNRELRFAVENHMLVEQHRYLIRDLGHARSAISALKQVVQAKEERCEHFEAVNLELQQRIALLESILTPDQRRQLAGLPCAFVAGSSDYSGPAGALTGPADDSADNAARASQPGGFPASDAGGVGAGRDDDDWGHPRGGPAPPPPVAEPHAERRHGGRPLSGFATGYTFTERPVHQLPRVFSGDYSTSEVQAMETSVEALASAITAMPRDLDSVEDIIASKMPSSADLCSDDLEPSPAVTKPRSRFLSVLRRPSRTSSVAESAGRPARNRRRSVSLGNSANPHRRQQPVAVDQPVPGGRDRSRPNSDMAMTASCPVLTAAAPQPQQRQASGSRYPAGLGLSDGDSSTGVSRAPSASGQGSLESMATHGSQRKRASQRLSLSAQPRRSTSAPSRPHSVQVASRRSWLSQLFGGRGAAAEPKARDAANDEVDSADELDDFAGVKPRRRRVMTQSSDEMSRFLGKLGLESAPPHAGASAGVLEDVVDVSGEDEERASRPSLSVAEIRRQTLDALNGTLRGAPAPLAASRSPPTSPPETAIGTPTSARWRQPDAAAASASIRRLGLSSPPAGDSSRRDRDSAASYGRSRRAQSWVQGTDTADGDADCHSQRWAPGLWPPQSLAAHAAARSPVTAVAHTWSPRGSSESGRRASDEARLLSPRGSMRAPGSSPWEMVKMPDGRNFPLSPGRSGSSPSQPARALAYFEDSAVPDADELTAAARRSLSLRMSRTSFRQAEPLPESEDTGAAEDDGRRSASTLSRPGSIGPLELAQSPRNPALARVASAVQPKRRSLLRQLTPKAARAAPRALLDSLQPQPAVTPDDPPPPPADHDAPSARRAKKWWTAVLG